MIIDLLQNKTVSERATIKGQELAKIGAVARTNVQFSGTDIDIEIVSWKAIEKGVEVFVRAWKNGEQIGFGKDGSVDVERFVIINPPILVSDPTGDIVREWNDPSTGEPKQRRLREAPQEAILHSIAHTISVKKEKFGSEKIVKDKVGNTTSTLYPAAGANSPMDEYVSRIVAGDSWATMRAGAGTAGGSSVTSTFNAMRWRTDTVSNQWDELYRAIVCFDTSVIATDTISSAVLSIFGLTKADPRSNIPALNAYSATPASFSTNTDADFNKLGTTQFATSIGYAAFSTVAYNDLTLNATGIAYIDPDDVTAFGLREATYDAGGSTPTWGGGTENTILEGYGADQVGTDNDPKLVVEHAAASTFTPKIIIY